MIPIKILETESGYEDLQTVFGTYITLNETDSCAVKLEEISNLDGVETDWLSISEILLSLNSEGKTWFDMDSTQQATIRVMANQQTGSLAKIQSQIVLNLVYGDTFPVIIDEEEVYLRQAQQQTGVSTWEKDNELKLIPNPATDLVEISIPGENKKVDKITFADIQGRELLQLKNHSLNNSCTLNTQQLTTGLYLVKVTGTNGTIYKGKLLIIR